MNWRELITDIGEGRQPQPAIAVTGIRCSESSDIIAGDKPTSRKSKSARLLNHPRTECRLLIRRSIFFLCSAAVMLTGLASRRYREQLPLFLAEYGGDTLWALMLYLLVSFILADRPVTHRWLISMLFAMTIEVSQLFHAPWIDSIWQTNLGGLVLGFGFLWTDLVCYSVGIIERVV